MALAEGMIFCSLADGVGCEGGCQADVHLKGNGIFF